MRYATSVYEGLVVNYTVCLAGETHVFRVTEPTARADVLTTQYWAGAFRYEKPDGSTLADITRGMLGIDLPDFPEVGDYTLRAMADGAQYFCVSSFDKVPTQKRRISLAAQQSAQLPVGHIAILDDGTELQVVVAKTQPVQIDGPCVGLEVWL